MTRPGPRNAVIIGLATAAVVVGGIYLNRPRHKDTHRLAPVTAAFLKVLPKETTDDQRQEIEGLLARFDYKSGHDEIPVKDQVEINKALVGYIEKGAIEKHDLYMIMAKVGYYTSRSSPEDTLSIHPLLEPIEMPGDSTRNPTK